MIIDYLENKISYLALVVAAIIGFFFYWICVIFLYLIGFPFWLIGMLFRKAFTGNNYE